MSSTTMITKLNYTKTEVTNYTKTEVTQSRRLIKEDTSEEKFSFLSDYCKEKHINVTLDEIHNALMISDWELVDALVTLKQGKVVQIINKNY